MIVCLDGEGPETPLPDMAAAMVLLMVAADMRRREPHHVLAEVAVAARPQHQMEVIGHQAIGEKADIDSLAGFA